MLNLSCYLNEFLNHVVEDEENEDAFTGHDKVVPGIDIADQLHCAEVPGRDRSSGRRELHYQP